MIQIDLRSNLAIYEQIVAQFKEQIVRGLLRPGDAIPSIRKLAMETRTNPNTVARAYQELERMGLIENLIGKGAFIKARPELHGDALIAARAQLSAALMEMTLAGLSRGDIIAEVERALLELGRDDT